MTDNKSISILIAISLSGAVIIFAIFLYFYPPAAQRVFSDGWGMRFLTAVPVMMMCACGMWLGMKFIVIPLQQDSDAITLREREINLLNERLQIEEQELRALRAKLINGSAELNVLTITSDSHSVH